MSFRLDQRAFGYKGLIRSIRGFVGGFPQLIASGAEVRQGAPGASPFPASVGSGEIFIAPGPTAQTGRLRATVTVGGGNGVAQFSLAYVGQGSPPAPLSPDFQSPVFPAFAQTLTAGEELLENDIFLVITSSVAWIIGNVVDMDIVPTTNTTPWVERRWFGDEFNSPNFSGDIEWISQGPGDTSPSARVTVGLTTFTSGAIKDFNCYNFDGFSDTSPFTPSASQPNRSPASMVHMDEQAMDYHITVNSRRFIVGLRLAGGVWQSIYLGFFIPYAGLVSYPYPIAVGGNDEVNDVPSSVTNTHSSWWDPQTITGVNGALRVRTPAGGYQAFWNKQNGAISTAGIDNVVWPYGQTSQVNSAQFHTRILGQMARSVVFNDGIASPDPDLKAFNLLQTVLFSVDFAGGVQQTLGFLDGVFHITAEGNAGGNTLVLESPEVTYLVLQNTFRTTRRDMVAIRMDP